MPQRNIYAPLYNLSFNAGYLNPAGLVKAEGVIHVGSSYIALPPWRRAIFPDISGIVDMDDINAGWADWPGPDWPGVAHICLSPRTAADGETIAPFTIILFVNGKFIEIIGAVDSPFNPTWSYSDVSPTVSLAAVPRSDECRFVSFGKSIIFAAGHGAPVQILLDGAHPDAPTPNKFIDCFTSTDKPKAKYVGVMGQRLVFGNIANVGTAALADETATSTNESLLWWGASNQPRVIGNPLSHPKDNTDFKHITDDSGVIRGISSGKDSAVILKDNSVWALTLGGPFGFEVPRIQAGIGCTYPRSLVDLADDTYFWSKMGPGVLREGQVLLLGDGQQPLRDLFPDSPPDNQLHVIAAGADVSNGLIMWLVFYRSYNYTYAEVGPTKVPTEGYDQTPSADTYALVVYNAISNQLSFAWKELHGSVTFRSENLEDVTTTVPLTLVDRIPIESPFALSGIGLFAYDSYEETGEPILIVPYLANADLSGEIDIASPELTFTQKVILRTGLIPFSYTNSRVLSVRPVLRTRRACTLPAVRVRIYTCLSPHATLRAHGPFEYSTAADPTRGGFINCGGVSECSFAAIELEIDPRTGDGAEEETFTYAYLISEIEGIEIVVSDAGKAV